MKKLLKNTDLIAGILAIVATGAIVCEVAFGGFSKESVVGGIKDLAGILADVIVLVVAASVFIKRKQKNINSILSDAIKKWGDDNIPLIFKVEGFKQSKDSDYTQGFALLQNPREYISLIKSDLNTDSPDWLKYASYSSKVTGKFIDMPSIEKMTAEKFDVCIVMNQSHFKNIENFDLRILPDIIDCVKAECAKEKYGGNIKVYNIGKDLKFKVEFEHEIRSIDDVGLFIDVLNYIVSIVKVIA